MLATIFLGCVLLVSWWSLTCVSVVVGALVAFCWCVRSVLTVFGDVLGVLLMAWWCFCLVLVVLRGGVFVFWKERYFFAGSLINTSLARKEWNSTLCYLGCMLGQLLLRLQFSCIHVYANTFVCLCEKNQMPYLHVFAWPCVRVFVSVPRDVALKSRSCDVTSWHAFKTTTIRHPSDANAKEGIHSVTWADNEGWDSGWGLPSMFLKLVAPDSSTTLNHNFTTVTRNRASLKLIDPKTDQLSLSQIRRAKPHSWESFEIICISFKVDDMSIEFWSTGGRRCLANCWGCRGPENWGLRCFEWFQMVLAGSGSWYPGGLVPWWEHDLSSWTLMIGLCGAINPYQSWLNWIRRPRLNLEKKFRNPVFSATCFPMVKLIKRMVNLDGKQDPSSLLAPCSINKIGHGSGASDHFGQVMWSDHSQ